MTDKAKTDPPPEHFRRTPEEIERERAEVAAEVESMRERTEAGEALPGTPYADPRVAGVRGADLEDLGAVLARTHRAMQAQETERRAAPCWRTPYPNGEGWPEGRDHNAEALAAAAKSCRSSGFVRDRGDGKPCPYHTDLASFCPAHRVIEIRDAVVGRLLSADVPENERDRILAALQLGDPLWETDALQVVRAFVRRARATVKPIRRVVDGKEIAGNLAEVRGDATKVERSAGTVEIYGSERVAFFGGNVGRGKTLAACRAIAHAGGKYLTEYRLARPKGVDLEEVAGVAGVVVIDQVGRAHLGDARYALTQLEELIDHRYARNRLTILVGNLTWEEFAKRYQSILADRILGQGVFVEFGGSSLRAHLRGAK